MTDYAKEMCPFELAFLERSNTCGDDEALNPNSLTRCACNKPFASAQSQTLTESRYNQPTDRLSISPGSKSCMKHASQAVHSDQHVHFCAPLVTAELARYDANHPAPLKEHHKHRHGSRKTSPPPALPARPAAKEATSPEDVMMAAWIASRKG